MKTIKASTDSDPGPRLQGVNQYLEKNFPDFFAEARFQVGDDDYFLYARFGQYLARTIEQNRVSRDKINRGFTVLNKMARVSARNPRIREMLVSGPLEYIVDAPKARALARKRLSPVAQGYMESLCEERTRAVAAWRRGARRVNSAAAPVPSARLPRRQRNPQTLRTPDDVQRNGSPHRTTTQLRVQRVDPIHRRIIDRDHQIPRPQVSFCRRPLLIPTHDLNSARNWQIERAHQTQIERPVAHGDAEVSAPNTPLRQNLRENPLRSTRWHGEPDSLRHRNNGRIDTDHPSPRVHQRTTRITRIERGCVLHDSFNEPTMATPKRAPQCTDYPSRHC